MYCSVFLMYFICIASVFHLIGIHPKFNRILYRSLAGVDGVDARGAWMDAVTLCACGSCGARSDVRWRRAREVPAVAPITPDYICICIEYIQADRQCTECVLWSMWCGADRSTVPRPWHGSHT